MPLKGMFCFICDVMCGGQGRTTMLCLVQFVEIWILGFGYSIFICLKFYWALVGYLLIHFLST